MAVLTTSTHSRLTYGLKQARSPATQHICSRARPEKSPQDGIGPPHKPCLTHKARSPAAVGTSCNRHELQYAQAAVGTSCSTRRLHMVRAAVPIGTGLQARPTPPNDVSTCAIFNQPTDPHCDDAIPPSQYSTHAQSNQRPPLHVCSMHYNLPPRTTRCPRPARVYKQHPVFKQQPKVADK